MCAKLSKSSLQTVKMTDTKAEVVCCCCFGDEDLFNMLEPHQTYYDKVEIYATIIAECFHIELYSSVEEYKKMLYMICKNCVFRLRDAVKLQSQIQTAFDHFQGRPAKRTKAKKEASCCFCCVSNEDLFSILKPHKTFQKKKENYSTIIAECFQIKLNCDVEESKKNLYVMCKNCIFRLRDAFKLRSEIQTAYDRFQDEYDEHKACDTDAVSVGKIESKSTEIDDLLIEETPKQDKFYFNSITKGVFICDVCERVFLLKASLITHMYIHQNDNAFICDVCDEEFEDKNSLKAHTVVHLCLDETIKPRTVIEFCLTHRIIMREIACPKCNQEMRLNKREAAIDKYAWQCRNKHQVLKSVRVGSWFELSKLSIITILRIVQLWCIKATTDHIIRTLNLGNETVKNWRSMCREVCKRVCTKPNEMLGGPGIVVEIAETEYRMGAWVIGGMERKTKKFFLVVELEISKERLMDVIRKYITPGSIVVSNSWKMYYCSSDEEYVEMKENRTCDFVESQTAMHTKNVNVMFTEMKQSLPRTLCKDTFDSYVYEFMWKKNLERQGKNIFSSFLEALKDLSNV